MSTPDPEPTPSGATTKAALRGLLVYLLFATPLAATWFLYSADLFDAYHGVATCYRPLPGSDGIGDRVMRFVLERPSKSDLELVLPTDAFTGHDLPRCPNGIPPRKRAEDAPTVHKDAFALSFGVEGRAWPTPTPADLFFPVLLALLGLPLRNYFATGSPFHLAGRHTPPPILRTNQGKSGRSRGAAGKGPPPSHLRKSGKRRRRR